MPNASDFHPEKIPVADFPFLVGSAVQGSLYARYTVVDRAGFAFVACCEAHERAGRASGWYPQREHGRLLAEFEAVPSPPPEWCGEGADRIGAMIDDSANG
jgi:hypothetical protein